MLLPLIFALIAQSPAATPQMGDRYEIDSVRESAETGSDGSSSSSHDRDTLIERIVAVRGDEVELEYDLPPRADPTAPRGPDWEYPARVLKSDDGSLRLLNVAELERRRDGWLARAKWSRSVCGRWIFTWNAFRIECDPQSVLKTIAAFNPWPEPFRAGAIYRDRNAQAPIPLIADGAGLAGEAKLDADVVRRGNAEVELAVAEISGKPPPSLADALGAHAGERIAGTIRVRFEGPTPAFDRRMSRITKVETVDAEGTKKTRTVTETASRRRLP